MQEVSALFVAQHMFAVLEMARGMVPVGLDLHPQEKVEIGQGTFDQGVTSDVFSVLIVCCVLLASRMAVACFVGDPRSRG
jgi:hypothetical protein